MSGELDVHTSDVQRDYVQGWVLSRLYAESKLADRLVLKGGSSFRKGYFPTARYSRDVDFSTATAIPEDELHAELSRVCGAVSEATGVEFQGERLRVGTKRAIDKEREVAEARLYFRDFYGEESKIIISLRLDVTQFDKIHLPVQERQLIHQYSDLEACGTAIRCLKLEELLALKLRCLLQRQHIADLWDLAFPLLIGTELNIDRAELLRTFFKVTIFGASPRVAKALFLDLPFEALRRFWTSYITSPSGARLAFDAAKQSLIDLVDALIPGEAIRERSNVLFPSVLRNPIMNAARSNRMVRLTYDGVTRLVEPYSLAFKVRRDGVAREYFYGYDTTGGRSTGPGIKTFLPHKVEGLEETDQGFEPRHDVELSKAGGPEMVGRFEAPPGRVHRGRTYNYMVVCNYCGRRFTRKRRSTTCRQRPRTRCSMCGASDRTSSSRRATDAPGCPSSSGHSAVSGSATPRSGRRSIARAA